mmetsp:Transcript_50461/g.163305  ORF Transcript_50461/g.163305 Transcript_50461/m.163305 type:complete len:203 (-) Transcript_50461:63-671(-)
MKDSCSCNLPSRAYTTSKPLAVPKSFSEVAECDDDDSSPVLAIAELTLRGCMSADGEQESDTTLNAHTRTQRVGTPAQTTFQASCCESWSCKVPMQLPPTKPWAWSSAQTASPMWSTRSPEALAMFSVTSTSSLPSSLFNQVHRCRQASPAPCGDSPTDTKALCTGPQPTDTRAMVGLRDVRSSRLLRSRLLTPVENGLALP